MSGEFTYVWLLPLLEQPFEAAESALSDRLKILGAEYELPTEIELQPLVVTALKSHSEYWSGLALQWLEDGFPVDLELNMLLTRSAEDRALSQRLRHKARRLVCRQNRGD